MGRLIDADKLSADMYYEAFVKDSDMQKWDSGCWIRYKMFENVLKAQPTVEAPDINVGNMDTISRQATKDIFTELYGISAIGSAFDKEEWADICETTANELPPIQPKGTRLSTVCLLCKKPAVTFNTEDDIPYTNYSYCEDCLRKGLKLLREQKKNLQAQPERKTGHWILDRSGAYCCDNCMEPCASYVMMKPRDKFCKMCGSRNEVME